ncbi:4835_t:CDS:2, partial [Dentiscutata heterogama]
VATRYKCAVALTSKTSSEIWNAIEKIYNDSKNSLEWPALLMINSASEFKGSFAKGIERYNVPIKVVDLYSFESLVLVKKFKQDLPVLYYLEDEPIDSTKHLIGCNPKRPFKREELQ